MSLKGKLENNAFTFSNGGTTYVSAVAGFNNLAFEGSTGGSTVLLTGITDPSGPQNAATKNYVDTQIAGISSSNNCNAASTANLSATYNNGTGGVGATLTNNSTQVAFVIDGYTTAVNDRILVKNQSTDLQNGIYVVTDIGSVSTNWILTRASDYNQITEIKQGNAIYVINGTTNSSTTWLETSVVATIGTDSITFVRSLAITALTGDVTASGPGNVSSTLSTVNSNVGTFGSSTQVGQFTVNAKGLITAASNVTVSASPVGSALTSANIWIGSAGNVAAANPITGDITLSNTGVTALIATSNTTLTSLANLATVGTIGTGTWQGSAVGAIYGGTSQTSYTLGDTLYSSATNVLSKLAGNTTAGIQYLSQTGTGAVSAAPVWATISGTDITGAALTKTDDTNVTLTLGGTPTTALLRAASITAGWTGQLGLTRGGTNASLTASNGGIVYSGSSALAILAGTATANQVLLSGSSTTPAWSTATYPATTTVSQLLYSSAANVVGGLATANSAVLVSGNTGVPSWSSTMTDGQLIVGLTSGTPTARTMSGNGTLSSTGVLTVTGGTATNIAVTTDNASGASVYPTWVTASGAAMPLYTTTAMFFTPSIGRLYASEFYASGNVNAYGTTAATASNTGAITTAGGIGISNVTNAVSATNGGTISTAGGVAVAKDLWVGGNATTNIGAAATTVQLANTSPTTVAGNLTWTSTTILGAGNFRNVVYGKGVFVTVNLVGSTSTSIYTSSDGITWTAATMPSAPTWARVCYAQDLGLFLAVSVTETAYSYTGTGTWISLATGLNLTGARAMCRGTNVSGGNVFVVLNGGSNVAYTSPNGITWATNTMPVPGAGNYNGRICWSDSLRLFVALGSSNSTSQIAVSSNGASWTLVTGHPSTGPYDVCWSQPLGMFVITGFNNTMYSTNGTTWTDVASLNGLWGVNVCWSDVFNIFMAVSGSGGTAWYSSNGTSWTTMSGVAMGEGGMTFGDNVNKVFVAVQNTGAPSNISKYTTFSSSGFNTTETLGTSGTTALTLNANTTNFTSSVPSTSTTLASVVYNGGVSINKYENALSASYGGTITTAGGAAIGKDLWVAGSATTNIGATATTVQLANSTNATVGASIWSSWTTSLLTSAMTASLTYGKGLFVAVMNGTGTGTSIYTSPNGTSWSASTTPSVSNPWSRICYASDLGYFIVITFSAAADVVVAYSTTGTGTWATLATGQTISQSGFITRGTNVSGGNIFVAMAGTANTVYRSSTGATWVSSAVTGPGAGVWNGNSCWSDFLQLFVVISQTASTTSIGTSPDGITWTPRTISASSLFYGVCWSPLLRIFVAVGNTAGSVGTAYYSTNGTTWTICNGVALGGVSWITVTWSNTFNVFTAMNGGYAMYSSDGINWTTQVISPSVSNIQGFSAFGDNDSKVFISMIGGDVTKNIMSSNSSITGYNNISILGTSGTTDLSLSANKTTYTSGVSSISSTTGSVIYKGGIGIDNYTDASSSTVGGALTIAGGAAIGKNLYVGGNFNITGTISLSGTTESTSSTTGAITTAGGVGISKNMWIGSSYTNTTGITTTAGAIINIPALTYTNTNANSATITNLNIASINAPTIASTGTSTTVTNAASLYIGNHPVAGTNVTITDRWALQIANGRVKLEGTNGSNSSTAGVLALSGGMGIALTTDASSSTNGGSLTTAGGVAIAKQLFVGTNVTLSGTSSILSLTGQTAGLSLSGVDSYVTVSGEIETTSSTTGTIRTAGGISSSNLTNASSATDGGSLTLAGGAAIAQDLYVGGIVYSTIAASSANENRFLTGTTDSLTLKTAGGVYMNPSSNSIFATNLFAIGGTLNSTIATGTAPIAVTSTTPVANLTVGRVTSTSTASGSTYYPVFTIDSTTINYNSAIFVTPSLGRLYTTELYPSSQINAYGTTNATSTTTGTIVTSGGMSMQKDLWVGGNATTNIGAAATTVQLANVSPTTVAGNLTWNSATILGTGNFESSIIYGKGVFVALNVVGSTSTSIYTSSNGASWTASTTPSGSFGNMCYAQDLGLFLAVNNTTSISSSTGTGAWTTVATGLSIVNGPICRGTSVSGGNVFVMTSTAAYVSATGASWASYSMPTPGGGGSWYGGVCWSDSLRLFVACSLTASTTSIAYSSNGTSWTLASATPISMEGYDVCWSQPLGMFVVTGYQATLYSTNGISWSTTAGTTNLWGTSVCWSNAFNIFVVLGGNNGVWYSSDGINWTTGTSGNFGMGNSWYELCSGDNVNKLFVAGSWLTTSNVVKYTTFSSSGFNTAETLGTSGTTALTLNANTTNFTSGVPSTSTTLASVVYNGGVSINNYENALSASYGGALTTAGGAAIAKDLWVGGNATTNIGASASTVQLANSVNATSQASALSWTTTGSMGATNQYYNNSMCFANDRFVGVSYQNGIYTSTDGITWTAQTSPTGYRCICYASDIGRFVACIHSGTTASYSTSLTANTWTTTSIPYGTTTWYSVCRGTSVPGGNLFAAVNSSASTSSVMTSPDGITWTSRTTPGSTTWNGICWSDSLRLFVSSGVASASSCIMTSSDGVTWTGNTTTTVNLYSICWSPDLSMFVACGTTSGLTTALILYSTSGTGSWTTVNIATSGASTDFIGVVWSSTWKMFVAVGRFNNGVSSLFAYSSNGVNWTSSTFADTNQAWAVAYGLKRFVIACNVNTSGAFGYYSNSAPTGYNNTLTVGSIGTTTLTSLADSNVFSIDNPSYSSTTGTILSNGGIGINNYTNALSATNGGALTIAGGAAIGKDLWVGGLINAPNQTFYAVSNASGATTSVPSATVTTVDSFQTGVSNQGTGSNIDNVNGILTVRYAGVYLTTATIMWSSNGSGARSAWIEYSGDTNNRYGWDQSQPTSAITAQLVSGVIYMTAGSNVRIKVVQDSGSTLTIGKSGSVTGVYSITRLS